MFTKASRLLVIFAMAALLTIPKTNWAQDNEVGAQATTTQPAAASVAYDEMSPGQIIIKYENGYLTIQARNAPLLDVLRRVCSEIGAECDSPAGSSEPVFADLGPGPAREVLTSFLSGSRFNYAMQATDEDPNVLARLIVTPIPGPSDTHNRATEPQVSSRSAAVPVTASVPAAPAGKDSRAQRAQQMKDILAQAKNEIAELVSARDGMDDGDASAAQANAEGILGLFENAIKRAETADADAPPSDSQPTPAQGDGSSPGGRPRHRRR